MFLETAKEVSYNLGLNETKSEIIQGHIESLNWLHNWTTICINYLYKNVDGEIIKRSTKLLNFEEINVLNSLVENQLDPNLTYFEKERMRVFLAFKIEMSKTFGVESSDINIKQFNEQTNK